MFSFLYSKENQWTNKLLPGFWSSQFRLQILDKLTFSFCLVTSCLQMMTISKLCFIIRSLNKTIQGCHWLKFQLHLHCMCTPIHVWSTSTLGFTSVYLFIFFSKSHFIKFISSFLTIIVNYLVFMSSYAIPVSYTHLDVYKRQI